MTQAPSQLREAHAHIPSHGRALSMLMLDRCSGVEECLGLLAIEAAKTRGWVLAAGARIEGWTDPRWPTRAELDRACPDRPCCVMSFDHHSVAANTAAIVAGKLLGQGPEPAGGVVCRDEHGEPTGALLEAAAYQVWNAAPEPTPEERRGHVVAALKDLMRHGFAEVHDLLSPSWLGPLLADLDRDGQLPVSVRLYAPIAEVEAAHERARTWETQRVRLAGAKIFADGTLNSSTAWMLAPYRDPLSGLERGKVVTPSREIRIARERTAALGLGLAVHAIGDAAVRAVLDAEQTSRASRAGRTKVPSLRIEHCELIDRADVARFAGLGVIASVQPCHLLTDIEVLRRQLPHRLDRVLPLRELIDAGCEPGLGLIFGSDTPIVRPDPKDNIQAAVFRRREGMSPDQAIAPAQGINEAEAWRAYAISAGSAV